jgi:hypothetical protein
MVVNALRRKDPHTLPAYVCRALLTGNVVATSVLLDQDLALWALLDVLVTFSPTFQQPLLCFRVPMDFPLLAAEPIVFFLTGDADSHEARSTPENSISGTRFESVDFWTVGGGAVSELVRMVTEIFEEADF